ncbi:CUB domain-containing protein [Trichonephila clavata]|uniref:CUB domain-containing protein n=1 Tax=Trichonephila clavata TaxID=2740835 RepID=A0A8X6IDW3_TRICU|nr:CUB domain-containing protein [Trichonephila clavata]
MSEIIRAGEDLELMSPLSTADNCQTSSGLIGSCLSAQDCMKRGGRGVETCAWGLGVCCVYISSCDSTSSANLTYFTSPGYPNSWSSNSGVCTFTLRPKLFSRICQLRLDFEEFYVTGPTAGMCSTDLLAISGQDLNNIVPVICGLNTGQHMYLQVGSSAGPFRITITTSGESEERKWRIRVTQIPCGSNALAPAHCLQYFTGAVGQFQSFNYGNIKSIEENTYFLNMNYAICIRKEASMCGATFTSDGDFNVNVWNSTINCSNDYLSFGTSRKCGKIPKEELKAIKLANAGPLIVSFVSDDKHTTSPVASDSGFNFKYTQFACSSGM